MRGREIYKQKSKIRKERYFFSEAAPNTEGVVDPEPPPKVFGLEANENAPADGAGVVPGVANEKTGFGASLVGLPNGLGDEVEPNVEVVVWADEESGPDASAPFVAVAPNASLVPNADDGAPLWAGLLNGLGDDEVEANVGPADEDSGPDVSVPFAAAAPNAPPVPNAEDGVPRPPLWAALPNGLANADEPNVGAFVVPLALESEPDASFSFAAAPNIPLFPNAEDCPAPNTGLLESCPNPPKGFGLSAPPNPPNAEVAGVEDAGVDSLGVPNVVD